MMRNRRKADPKVLSKLQLGTPVPKSTALEILRRLASRHDLGSALIEFVPDPVHRNRGPGPHIV
jgi:hypothetical protein